MSDVIALTALFVALVALAISWRQLILARQAYSRGLVIGSEPTSGTTKVVNGVEEPREFEFTIASRGPGTHFDITGTVVTPNGPKETVIKHVSRLDNTSPDTTGRMLLTTEQAKASWFVVTWITAHRDGIRTNAYRVRVLDTGQDSDTARSRTRSWLRGKPETQTADEPFDGTYETRIEQFHWDPASRIRNQLWQKVADRVPHRVRKSVPDAWAERFRRSGHWRELPPPVPVRGLWPDE